MSNIIYTDGVLVAEGQSLDQPLQPMNAGQFNYARNRAREFLLMIAALYPHHRDAVENAVNVLDEAQQRGPQP